jgi:CubicO group peptidase (beta-lactamase class C family)
MIRTIALLGIVISMTSNLSLANSNSDLDLESIREHYGLTALGGLASRGDRTLGAVSGLRKHGSSTHVTTNDKWHLGSCTKAMTSTMIATFVEDGLIDWTTSLKDLFPDIADMQESYRTVTLEMLLAHRAGLGDMSKFNDGNLWKKLWDPNLNPVEGRALVARVMLATTPAKTPNSEFFYTNAGYVIAAAAIERISGHRWEVLMQERLFRPLGMTSCGFGAAGSNVDPPDQPWGHHVHEGQITPIEPGLGADNPPAIGPAASVHCSMSDWNKFLQLHVRGFRGEPTAIMQTKSFERLHTTLPGQDYTPGGWIRVDRPWANGPAFTHGGSNTLNLALTWIAPNINFAALAVTNRADTPAHAAVDAVTEVLAKELIALP